MLASLFFAVALLAQAAAVPAGVILPAQLDGALSSRDAKAGDHFTFSITEDTHAGALLIPKGTRGQGVVRSVSAAAGTHRGSLVLAPEFVLFDGTRVPVRESGNALAQTARRHTFPLLVPVAGFIAVGAFQNPGGNVTLGKGTLFRVETQAVP